MQAVPVWGGSVPDRLQKSAHTEEEGGNSRVSLQRMNVRLAKPYPPPLPTPAEEAPQRTETPLDQRTAFRTQGGLHLLFEPEAADEWMARGIETCEGGPSREGRLRCISSTSLPAAPCGRTGGPSGPYSRPVPAKSSRREPGLCHAISPQGERHAYKSVGTVPEDPNQTETEQGK